MALLTHALIVFFGCGVACLPCGAQTSIIGPVSGTWTTNGSPYIFSGDCTVPTGQNLIIQPGVVIIIGPGLSFSINGRLQAVGETNRPIIFRGANSAAYWNQIRLNYSGVASTFRYCAISDATNGLFLSIIAVNATMTAEIESCRFANCIGSGIAGQAIGGWTGFPYAPLQPYLSPQIANCVFVNGRNGVTATADGQRIQFGGGGAGNSYGGFHFTLRNCRFIDLAGAAVETVPGSYPASSPVGFANNTVVRCRTGVLARDPFDVDCTNNIFTGAAEAVRRTGSLSAQVFNNCLFQNETNFTGYNNTTYGNAIFQNRNGDPCDAGFNIFLPPQFECADTLLLAAGSPCIDAGSALISDVCFPPSLRSTFSDMGAFGGPDACTGPLQCQEPKIISSSAQTATCVGMTAMLSVTATGPGPLTYQWYFNGLPLSGQTNAILSLVNVQTNNAGSYRVTVANSAGSTTSDPVTLIVGAACYSLALYPGLSISGQVGKTYCVQYTTNLSANPVWLSLTNFTLTTPDYFYRDPRPARNCDDGVFGQPMVYYRVVEGACP